MARFTHFTDLFDCRFDRDDTRFEGCLQKDYSEHSEKVTECDIVFFMDHIFNEYSKDDHISSLEPFVFKVFITK